MESLSPFLQGSFIPYNMPVYPGAQRKVADPDLWHQRSRYDAHGSHMSEKSASRGITFSSMSMEAGMWEMPDPGTSGVVGGSDIFFRRDRRVVINLSLRRASLYIDIVLLSDLPSAPPPLSTLYRQQTKTLSALVDSCVSRGVRPGLVLPSTQHLLGGLPGKDHCNVWTNDG
jgi:hypothetical protein